MAKKGTRVTSTSKNSKSRKVALTTTKQKTQKPVKAAKKVVATVKKSTAALRKKQQPKTKKVAKVKPTKRGNTSKPSKSSKLVDTKPPKAPRGSTKVVNASNADNVAESKVPYTPKGYTADEYAKFKQEKAKLSKLGNIELKAVLKKNLQSMSGNKDEMIEKIADGIVLGRIPRCPNCFGGRPRYDYKTGKYNCPGYRDDQDYKNCHSIFTKQELKRDPWQA